MSHRMSPSPSPDAAAPRVSRRTFLHRSLGASLALGAGGMLGACGGSSGGGGKATVRMWTWYTQQREQFPKLIAEFERAHPNIKIENRLFGDTNSYLPALQASVASGDVPEIFGPHVLAIQYGKNGVSADLKKELGASFLTDFFDSANAEYSVGDSQYALGWMAQTFGIFYDPKTFAQAGVDVPETWDDLITAAGKLRTAGVIPCILANNPGTNGNDFLLPLITQATDNPKLVLDLDQQVGGAKWDSKPVVDALSLVDKLRRAGVFGSSANGLQTLQGEAAFYTGKAASLFMGSWVPQDFQQNAPASFVKRYKVMQTPAWAAGRKHWCGNQAGAGLAVANNSKNKDAALEFVKFLYQTDRYAKVMNDSNSMPSTKSAGEQVSDPVLKEMTSWLLKGNGAPHILFGQGSSDAVASSLAALIGGKKAPAAAATEIQKAVDQARRR
jgi:ABC-type glycerol-3-phosphate transport system substrate-binding protein